MMVCANGSHRVCRAKVNYSDVPEDYAKFVLRQWAALLFFGVAHPFVYNCADFSEQGRVQFLLASDWHSRDKESFQKSEKVLWVLPADHAVYTTLEAYYFDFCNWIVRLAQTPFLVADFDDLPVDVASQYLSGIKALTEKPIDWEVAVASPEMAKIAWDGKKKVSQKPIKPCVYFIHAIGTNKVKIGTTKGLDSRVAALKTSSPYPIKVLAVEDGDTKKEKEYHRKFAEYRESGEWFRVEGALKQHIEQMTLEEWKDA